MSDERAEVYEFGEFRLDVGERTLARRLGPEPITIPEKAFQALVLLVRNHGTLVRKEALLSAVWPGVFVEEGNLGKAIHTVRRALGDVDGRHAYVETVAKNGYRFVAGVVQIPTNAARRDAVPIAAHGASAQSPAYDLYIRGKVKAASENVDDIDGAIATLQAAVAADPLHAGAYAQLARAYNTRAFKFTSQSESRHLQEHADVALAKALDLDANLAEAHFARGLILWTKTKGFPHEQAIKAFRRALELDPDADEAHHQLSMVYAHVGLLDEAQAHVARAVDVNPNNTMARYRVGVYTAWQGRFEAALAVLKTVPSEVSPMLIDRVRAEVLVQLGRHDAAQVLVDRYLTEHPTDEGGSLTSVRALLLGKARKKKEAERTIAQAVELGSGFGHFHHTAYNVASTYAALHEFDKAVRWLEAAADDGFPCYSGFKRDPNLDPLRGHGRFIELMAVLHAQWRRFKRLTEA